MRTAKIGPDLRLGLVATSSNFCFSGQFLNKTMIGLEHISNTKKSTISQKTLSYAKFASVNQPESKVQKEKMYISITISKKYSETKAKSTHTPTHRLARPVQSRMCTDISPRQWLLRTAFSLLLGLISIA